MSTKDQPKARIVATFRASEQIGPEGEYHTCINVLIVDDTMTCGDLMRLYEVTSKRFLSVGQLQLTRKIQQ